MLRVAFALVLALLSVSAVADFEETLTRERQTVERSAAQPAMPRPAAASTAPALQPALQPVVSVLRI